MSSGILSIVAILIMSILTFFMCTTLGLMGLVVIPTGLILIVLTSRPMKLVAFFWAITVLAPALEALLPSVIIKSAEQLVSLYILALLLGEFLITRRGIPGSKSIVVMVLLLLFMILLSAIANRVPKQSVLFYGITYLKHIWVFLFVLRHARPSHARAVIHAMLATFALQILLNIAAVLGINPLPMLLQRGGADLHVGSIGSAHDVGYLMVAGIFVMSALFRSTRGGSSRIAAFTATTIAFVQFFFTFTLHAYALLGGGFVLQYLALMRRRAGQVITAVLLTSMLATLGTLLFNMDTFREARKQLFTPQSLLFQWDRVISGSKAQAYNAVFLKSSQYLRFPWIGGGPGNYTSRIAYMNYRPLSRLQHMSDFFESRDPRIRMGGSIMGSPRTGYISLYGELGPGGLVLFWGIYLTALMRVWQLIRNNAYDDLNARILAEGFIPTVIGFLIMNIIMDLEATLHLTIGIWIWAAVIWNPQRASSAPQALDQASAPPPYDRLRHERKTP